MPDRRQLLIAGLGAILLFASLAAAQQIFVGGGRGFAPRFAKLEDFDGSFLYCGAFYQGGWTTDYPGADNNFSIRLAELTRISVKFDETASRTTSSSTSTIRCCTAVPCCSWKMSSGSVSPSRKCAFSPRGYAIGVNVVVYALTH